MMRATFDAPGFPEPSRSTSWPPARATRTALGKVPRRYATGINASATMTTLYGSLRGALPGIRPRHSSVRGSSLVHPNFRLVNPDPVGNHEAWWLVLPGDTI